LQPESNGLEGDQGRAGGRHFDHSEPVFHGQDFLPGGGPRSTGSYRRSAQGHVGGVVDARRVQPQRGGVLGLYSRIDRQPYAAIQILVEGGDFDFSGVAA